MKKTIIITGIVMVFTFIALFIFNKAISGDDISGIFAEVTEGRFEISVSTTGELIAENSLDIVAPDVGRRRGVRSSRINIQDLVSEGTEVKEGDWVATLDRTEYDNSLKDELENLEEIRTELEMAVLDTAVTLSSLRDQIENQIHTVTEAEITLRNSLYEPPTTIRQAEIRHEQAVRELEQMRKSYTLAEAQAKLETARVRQAQSGEAIAARAERRLPQPRLALLELDRFSRTVGRGKAQGSHHQRVVRFAGPGRTVLRFGPTGP